MDLEFAVFSKTFSVDFSEIVSCIDLRQVPYYEIPIIADKGTIRTFKKKEDEEKKNKGNGTEKEKELIG